MLAVDLITEDVPPLRQDDTGQKALVWMDEFKVTHLPVIEGTRFLGLVAEADILDLNSANDPIKNNSGNLIKTFVFEHQHVYDVMKIISETGITVVPVIGKDERYSGCITLSHLMKVLAKIACINDPGSVVILQMNQNDYVLSEIARIVEENNARILSSYITSSSESTSLEVTIKINKQEIGGILQSLRRYDYNISASFQENDYQDDLRERYESLMKFLNI